MQIPSPNEGKPFKQTKEGLGYYYETSHQQEVINYYPYDPQNPSKGVYPRAEVIEVPDNPEVVELKTGKSNSKYWQPEKVFTTVGCNHDFKADNISRREFVCSKCNWGVTVHINDIEETADGMSIKIKEGKFKVS